MMALIRTGVLFRKDQMIKQTNPSVFSEIMSTPSLERAVLRVLTFHVGRDRAVGSAALLTAVRMHGFHASERQVRDAVKQLRRSGVLIGSAAGEGGGYYILTSQQEFDSFTAVEFQAQISDMLETLQAMRDAARREWGDAGQPVLF